MTDILVRQPFADNCSAPSADEATPGQRPLHRHQLPSFPRCAQAACASEPWEGGLDMKDPHRQEGTRRTTRPRHRPTTTP